MHVAVHESMGVHFDPALLADYLRDGGLDATVVAAGEPLDGYDAVASFSPDEPFFDVPWVHCIRAGYDEFPVEAYAEAGITLTNSTGIHGTTIGETVAGMMLSFARRLHVYRDRQRAADWTLEPYERPFTLEDEQVCVVGLGTLGTGVVERANGLNMDVVGVRASGRDTPGVRAVSTPDALTAAVADARFVVLCTPLNEETEGLIDAEVFAAMREDAYLINVARGGVVDRTAMLDALETGAIAGMGIDAHHEEPLPADAPEWGMEEVIITPHVGAMVNTFHEDLGDLVLANAERIESGEDLVNRVV